MPRQRYQQHDRRTPLEATLPLDTVCTILTRQSTMGQGVRNEFSAEKNPKELIQAALRLGFANSHIQVLDWDMGIGAYNTTIEDRPALHHWLHGLLPSGKSRVVLVSQEDRLFRDRTEVQVNIFIEQVNQHNGWVVCGQRVYNFRLEMDREQFRMACKYGRMYVEYTIKGRLHPARHRAAMTGRFPGGAVPWGYVVDYDPRSSTHKHLIPYAPHAELITDQVFQRFARMAHPSPTQLAREWWNAGLVWPYFATDVDERRVRWTEKTYQRDEERGGYVFTVFQAQYILTNVAYLGWMVYSGQVAMDAAQNAPLICHQPLVDPEIFWWCFDHIEPKRPAWAPQQTKLVATRYRPHVKRTTPNEIPFLVAGKVRCASHGKWLAPLLANAKTRRFRLQCSAKEDVRIASGEGCPGVTPTLVEDALCRSLAQQLTFDERSIHELAKLLHERSQTKRHEVVVLQRQLGQQQALYDQAKRAILKAPDLADDFVADIRRAKAEIEQIEATLVEVRSRETVAPKALQTAYGVASLAERIRLTFPEWSRQAKARVLNLALDEARLGWVNRQIVGLWVRWNGAVISREEISSRFGRHVLWTPEEDQALRAWYHRLTWDALGQMLPDRTIGAIDTHSGDLELSRPARGPFLDMPPLVVRGPQVKNSMQAFGFPLSQERELVHTASS